MIKPTPLSGAALSAAAAPWPAPWPAPGAAALAARFGAFAFAYFLSAILRAVTATLAPVFSADEQAAFRAVFAAFALCSLAACLWLWSEPRRVADNPAAAAAASSVAGR